jgi:hypothetical protein
VRYDDDGDDDGTYENRVLAISSLKLKNGSMCISGSRVTYAASHACVSQCKRDRRGNGTYDIGLGMVTVVLGLPPPRAGALHVTDDQVVSGLVPEGRFED